MLEVRKEVKGPRAGFEVDPGHRCQHRTGRLKVVSERELSHCQAALPHSMTKRQCARSHKIIVSRKGAAALKVKGGFFDGEGELLRKPQYFL